MTTADTSARPVALRSHASPSFLERQNLAQGAVYKILGRP